MGHDFSDAIAALAGAREGGKAMTDLINTRVIVRSSPSGVWHGTLAAWDPATGTATLTDARRLWRWWAARGVSLSGVAAKGLHPDSLDRCRIAAPVSVVIVREVCEVLSCTAEASASVEAASCLTD